MNSDDRNDTLNAPPRDAGEQTDTASEATIARVAPSAGTVNEKPGSFGRYDLLDEIARGGMGVVYRAKQRELDRVVALKMILGTGISHEAAQRFLQEARAAAALDHPNVVPIYDIGEIGDRPYFTMALVEGPNLRGHVAELGTVPIPVAVALFAQITAGVAHAHQHGIIHRDLKPANVLIDKDGRPRVTDFGLAKRAAGESQLTVTGQVVGTPQYMAPEQARGTKDVGPAADVYALGAILYFLLTGQPPVQGESVTDVLIRVVTDDVTPPSQVRPDVPPEIEAICMRCLAKQPGERFPDAGQLMEAMAPITDQYVPPSGFTASLARASRGSTGTVGSLPSVAAVPDLTPTANVMPAAATVSVSAVSVPSAASVSVPAVAEPKPNRTPLMIALAVVAVLLLGAVGYLATRDKKPDEVSKGDPPPAAPQPGQSAPSNTTSVPAVPSDGPKPAPKTNAGVTAAATPNVEPKAEPKIADTVKEDLLAWPAPARDDFGLKVVLTAPAAKTVGDVVHLANDSPITLRITAEKDCRVSVWLFEPDGSVMRVFPNDYDKDDRVLAGKEFAIPSNDKYTVNAAPTVGTGSDRLRIIATTGEPVVFPPGGKLNQYTTYTSPAQREQLAKKMRTLVLKKAAPQAGDATVSETEVRFRVEK